MTEVMNTRDPVGGASGEEVMTFQVFPDSVERIPKLSRRLPSIVVEPTDGGEVESGELRWPPDDVSSGVREGHAQVTANLCKGLEYEGRAGANSPVAPPPGQGGGVRSGQTEE